MKLIKVLPFCIFLIFIKNAYSNEFNSNQLVISNVNVVDVETGKVISNQDVTISDKLIKSVNKYEKKKQSKESKIIDGSGKYLIPGLWDAHVHSVTNRDWHFPLMIAHGITSVRNLHTSEKEGFKLIKQIKKETESGAVIGQIYRQWIYY
ncbi:MAG: hypothetical protein OEY19_04775 [Gammaproteobacteria bacterium]|nr:hypothetical protein [Gammaproteobacteria bacterium]